MERYAGSIGGKESERKTKTNAAGLDDCGWMQKPKEEERSGASKRGSNLTQGRELVPKTPPVGTNFVGEPTWHHTLPVGRRPVPH